MQLPRTLKQQGFARKVIVAIAIAVGACALAEVARIAPGISVPLAKLDDLCYDSLYRIRPPEDRTHGPVVIIAVDQASLDSVMNPKANRRRFGWPWPRTIWAETISYLNRCGARLVAFDLLFNQPSAYGDDSILAKRVNDSKLPVIFGTEVAPDGTRERFEVPVKNPIFAAVTVPANIVVHRVYAPNV